LWPDWLRKIDTLLEDEAVIEVVAQALEARWPQSRRRGRPGTPAEVGIRMLILKHLFDWSYDELEREVRPIWSIACLRASMRATCPTPRPS
jgi:IS5 family transposase